MSYSINVQNGYCQAGAYALRVSAWVPDEIAEHVVFVPPFGEEMHIARKHIASIGEQLAGIGVAFYLYDAPGTGETIGPATAPDFPAHREVLGHLLAELSSDSNQPVSLLTLRSGFLVPLTFAQLPTRVKRFIACEPVTSGPGYLQNLIRQKTLAAKLRNEPIGSAADIARSLAAGGEVRVGGCDLTSDYYNALLSVDVQTYTPFADCCIALFAGPHEQTELSDLGFTVTTDLGGSRFWALEDAESDGIRNAIVDLFQP